ncbi:MAG TPA: 7TM domain-containing protein [Candidatus Pacearchaeota archaeon]|nr:7TM domain-containing protein [Candidatus Pacearchaeota archaeon]HOK94197.1 7TM domain-containing protein [Candidatus Pacearchaeota archaeon]HPO75419.1 7TM domain-containing protein [Candidatus Pacearchaeota archaeon]
MSPLVLQLINFGVPEHTIVLLLMLPVVATLITFAQQVIGVRGFGIYITSIIAYAFVATQLKYGIVIFFVVLLAGTLMRHFLRKVRILYLPRMAIILTFVALAVFLMFLLGSFLNIEGLQAISIFPILIMTLVVERFVAAQIEKGPKTAIFMTLETLILAIISYFLIEWTWLQQILLDWPLISLLVLFLINFGLGHWTGLRISEYFRFRELIEYLPKK